jgi:hypothetical protein
MSNERKEHDRKANFNNPLTLKLEYTFENIQLKVDDHDPSMKKILNNARKFGKQMREKMEVLYNENGYYAKRKKNILDFFQKKKGRQLTFRKLSFLNPFLYDVKKKEELLLQKEKLKNIKDFRKKLEEEKNSKIFTQHSKPKVNTINISSITSAVTNRTSRENSDISTDKRSKYTKRGLDSTANSNLNLPSVRKNRSNKELKAHFIRQMSGLINDTSSMKNSEVLNKNLMYIQNTRFHRKLENRPSYVSDEDLIPPVEIESLPFIYDENNRMKIIREKTNNIHNENQFEFDRFTKLNENSAFKHRDFLINKFEFIKEKDKSDLLFNCRDLKSKDSIPKIDLSSKVESILHRTKSGKKKIFENLEKKSEKMEILEKIRKEKGISLSTMEFEVLNPLRNKNKLKNNISC